MDSILHATVCKHVHLVNTQTTKKVSANVSHTTTTGTEYLAKLLDEKGDDGQLSALCHQVLLLLLLSFTTQ